MNMLSSKIMKQTITNTCTIKDYTHCEAFMQQFIILM